MMMPELVGVISPYEASTIYGIEGPLYTIVEKCTSLSKILAHDMVIWGKGWYVEEDEMTVNNTLRSLDRP